MENDITANPDYQLIMSFLKSIRPGDMSDEAATQLKMIGERIQSGGSLSDQEREMFQSVMGAMPQMPMDQGPMATGAAMTDADADDAKSAVRQDAQNFQGRAFRNNEDVYSGSSGVSSSLAPDTSMRPRPRPENSRPRHQWSNSMPNVNVENMEDNAIIFEEKMGFAHDADGLDLTDDQLVNFLLLCQKQYIMGEDEDEDEEYDEEYEEDDMMEMPSGKDVKVKVLKLDGSNVHEMMNKILGG
jgi:hypothetical protein